MATTPKAKTTVKPPKNDAVKDLLDKLPAKTRKSTAPLIQEAVPFEEGKKVGRKNHRREGVSYVRISPAIPEALKEEMDIAIKSTLKNRYPTIDTFVEAAISVFLSKQ